MRWTSSFQCAEERLGHGIVVADPGATDRLAQLECGEGIGELRRRVVTAPVGVEDRTGFERMIPLCHGDRRRDEWGLVVL